MSHNETLLPLVVHLLAGGLAGWVASWLWQRLHRYAPGPCPCPTLAPGQVAPALVLLTEEGPAAVAAAAPPPTPALRLVA